MTLFCGFLACMIHKHTKFLLLFCCAWILIRILAAVAVHLLAYTHTHTQQWIHGAWQPSTACTNSFFGFFYCLYNCHHLPLVHSIHSCSSVTFNVLLLSFCLVVMLNLVFCFFSSSLEVLFSVSKVVFMCFICLWCSFALKALWGECQKIYSNMQYGNHLHKRGWWP